MVMKPTRATPIMRAEAVADVRLGLRLAFSRARRPVVPETAWMGAPSRCMSGRAITGHGGDAHVRNLVRRFVEVGVPGYHIEDQKPGAKKCGHQGGKVLVAEDEQIKRLNAARFQLDVMKVPGIIVARTDAESATFLDACSDERDHPFILGATSCELPAYKVAYLAILRRLRAAGLEDARGHLLFQVSEFESAAADAWLERSGVTARIQECLEAAKRSPVPFEALLDQVEGWFVERWQAEAALKTYPRAIADVIESRVREGEQFAM